MTPDSLPATGLAEDGAVGARVVAFPRSVEQVQGHAARPAIGILMLDTRFHRLPGDIGNRDWPFPVIYRTVEGADPARVVHDGAEGLLDRFVAAGLALVDEGARAIATSCGFMALHQRELAAALPVPVATSSLLQAPTIEALLPPGRRVGILTFAAEALTTRHLAAVGVRPDTPIEGFAAESLFRKVYGGLGGASDSVVLEREAVEAALRLIDRHPDVGAILCECTNLPPHAAAIAEATKRAVHDVVGLVHWLAQGVVPSRPG